MCKVSFDAIHIDAMNGNGDDGSINSTVGRENLLKYSDELSGSCSVLYFKQDTSGVAITSKARPGIFKMFLRVSETLR